MTSRASVAARGGPVVRRNLLVRVSTQASAILASFLCSYLLYERMGRARTLDGDVALGVATFLILFLQLRLVDDFDDLERDLPGDSAEARAARRSRGTSMLVVLASAAALVCALNLQRPAALEAALSAMALMVVTPFVVKRHLTTNAVVLCIAYESIPGVIFSYVYFFQSATAEDGASPLGVLVVVATFWTAYQIWKFSRKIGENAMQPYFLSHEGMRRALLLLFALSSLLQLALWRVADLSAAFALYGCALPLAFAAWALRTWPAEARPSADPHQPSRGSAGRGWKGLTFIAALSAGLLVELLVHRTGA